MTLHLVDGTGYLHRAYHATVGRGPGAAVDAAVQMLGRIARDHAPKRAAVVLDPRGKTWRHERYADYKATRPPSPPSLIAELEAFAPAILAAGWPVVSVPRFEADDVIATLATRAGVRGWPVRVHASDRDLLALVDERVHQVDAKGQELGPAEVETKLGVPASRVTDWLAICGDASDNIPGVAGAGEKTAAELVRKYPDVDALIAANPKIRGRYPLSTPEGIEALRTSHLLVELVRDVPIDVQLDALVLGPRRAIAAAPLARSTLTAEQLEDFMERAAIMEIDGGLPRDEAERLALEVVMRPF